MMVCKETDKHLYFNYEGRDYGSGTVIKFTEEFTKRHFPESYTMCAAFHERNLETDIYKIGFNRDYDVKDMRFYHYVYVTEEDFYSNIEKIEIIGITFWMDPPRRITDSDCDDLMIAWGIYIVLMIACLIFKDWLVGWVALTYWILSYRKARLGR